MIRFGKPAKYIAIAIISLLSSCVLLRGVTSIPDKGTKVRETSFEQYVEEWGSIEAKIEENFLITNHEKPVSDEEHVVLFFKNRYLILPKLLIDNVKGIKRNVTGGVHEIRIDIGSMKNKENFKENLYYVYQLSWGFSGGAPGVIKCFKLEIN